MEKKRLGWEYLLLALTAFGGLGIEVLYAYFLEPFIYGGPMDKWSTMQTIMHWILTCVTWALVSFYVTHEAKRMGFNILEEGKKIKLWQWIAVLFCILITLSMSYNNWGGFKIVIEFQRLGVLKFIFQYIYYAVETILFMLIIVFAQKAFEVWFKHPKIPYGGIICGVTWGLVHALTKGSLWIGLIGIVIGFTYGVVYLLLNRDIKKVYPVLFIMFML